MEQTEMICCKCKNEISNDFKKRTANGNVMSIFSAWDSHRNNGMDFCCLKCMKEWRTDKILSLSISIILCLVVLIFVSIATGEFIAGLLFMFIPFMIRQWARGLRSIANSGAFGEFISFFLVLVASLTLVYPIYKLIQEIIWLRRCGQDISQAKSEMLESLDLQNCDDYTFLHKVEGAKSFNELALIKQSVSNKY